MEFRGQQFSFLVAVFLLTMSLAVPIFSNAQTNASCSFSTFSPPKGYSWPNPSGINDYGTIVGSLLSPPINTVSYGRGMVRYSNGAISTYNYPNAQDTFFSRRNDAGVTVGYYDTSHPYFHGIVLSGGKVVQVDYPTGQEKDTWLYGINKWGSIVGAYLVWINGNIDTGSFKLQNGKFIHIKYPGSNSTDALSINDNGAIVGRYSNTPLDNPAVHYHGFIFQNGQYKSIDDPQGTAQYGTQLNDINVAGVMVGNWISEDSEGQDVPHAFIYKNGIFEHIHYPGALSTSASGINKYGTVVGTAAMPANNGFGYNVVPYRAYCK